MARFEVGGGVAVIVDKQLKSKEITEFRDVQCDSVCVLIPLKPKPLILYLAYLSQQEPKINYQRHYHAIRQYVNRFTNHEVMVVGDWNLHSVTWQQDESHTHFLPTNLAAHPNSEHFRTAAEFLEKLMDVPLFQMTGIKNIASNVLDLVHVNETAGVNVCEAPIAVTDINKTDKCHPPLHISVYGEIAPMLTREEIEIWCFRRGNYSRMKQRLEAINFAHEFNNRTVADAFDFFYAIMNQLIIDNVPRKCIRTYPSKPSWWTRELQRKKNRKDKLSKRNPRGAFTNEYVQALKEYHELHDKLCKEDILRRERDIRANPTEFWKYAKANKGSTRYPSLMHYNNDSAESPEAIVNLFAKYFEGVYVRDGVDFDAEMIQHEVLPAADDITVSLWDIEYAISKLKPKGSGPDELHPLIIKNCAQALVFPIWLLFQKSFETGTIPSRLKLSRVIPLFKKGDRKNIANYRVIAISPIILKIFEIAVHRKLMAAVNDKLSNSQHGFRPRRSVTTNLLNLSIAAHKALENGKQLDVFYGDFESAFYRVCHRILIQKLLRLEIGEKTAKWVMDFLVNRASYVQIGNCRSIPYETASGVPAGSTLGPLLFLIFIDDITEVVDHASVLLFADDIKIYNEIGSSYDSLRLQSDINKLFQWCEANGLFFKDERTRCALLSIYRTRTNINAIYMMDGKVIERKNEVRDLGVLVDRRMQFSTHIAQITSKARQMIGYIKRISYETFSARTIKLLYSAYVRSKLECAAAIWDPHNDVYRDDIESVQKGFVMYLLGDSNRRPPYRLAPYEERCKTAEIQTLEKRRMLITAMIAFDAYKNNMYDINVHSKFVPFIRNSDRNLRRNRMLNTQHYATEYSYQQPLAKMIRLVNMYENAFLIDNRDEFKKKMLEILN